MTPAERDARAVDELAASRREMVAAVTRQIAFNIEQMQLPPAEAATRGRQRLAVDPDARAVDQVSWWELSNLIESDPERGQAAWQRLKDEAARELVMGVRTIRSVQRPVGGQPYERAQLLSILDGLRATLAPRDAFEGLLVQQMAAAFELHLRWQALVVQRMETDAWQGERDMRRAMEGMTPARRERYQEEHGWLPPRIGETAALDQAVMMADRYQRAYLRLAKALRDNRRLVGALVVAGGQVNIGERQVNVGPDAAPTRPARARSRGTPRRRTMRGGGKSGRKPHGRAEKDSPVRGASVESPSS